MPRPTIGDHAMSDAERQRKRRERLQQEAREKETLGERFRRLEEAAETFCRALRDYAELLAKHRQRFEDPRAFADWLGKKEFDYFDEDDRAALLAMADLLKMHGWLLADTVDMSLIDGPLSPTTILQAMQKRKAHFQM